MSKQNEVKYSDVKAPRKGTYLEGEVMKVEPKTLYIDVDGYPDVQMHLEYYGEPTWESFIGHVNKGDIVGGKFESGKTSSSLYLNRATSIKEVAFEDIEKLAETKEVIEAKVVKYEEKYLLLSYLDYNLVLPDYLLDHNLKDKKNTLKGKILKVVIDKAERLDNNRFDIRANQIPALMVEREKSKVEAREARDKAYLKEIEDISVGSVHNATVTKVEEHIAFVRIGGIFATLRIGEIDHKYIKDARNAVKEGDTFDVKVISRDGKKLSVSRKALIIPPFAKFMEAHHVGEEVECTLKQKLAIGMIFDIDNEVSGLLHQNEYSWNPNDNLHDFLKEGDKLNLRIVRIDPKLERVGLSRKQLLDNPWEGVDLKRGLTYSFKILEVTRDGIKVGYQKLEIEISNQELFTDKNSKADTYYTVGDNIEARVVDLDAENWVVKLSVRVVKQKEERENFEKYMKEEKTSTQTLGSFLDDTLFDIEEISIKNSKKNKNK
ncbi:MAG: S1 RNA-binding domain-containing protein [Acholeplasmatales bacterium]|jgi:small subunit ribosomal protein S1|nr:S1 RNA-binding domain-containing protein [Acholeplasmatales bacterium]